MKKTKLETLLISCGIIAAVFYMAHAIIGDLLWPEYNAITTDVSTLTSIGAPNRPFLLVLTQLYGVFAILFSIGMIIRSNVQYNRLTKYGFIVFLVMQIVSTIGYSLFPLDGHALENNFNNTMHIVVTGLVVALTLLFAYLVSIGFLKQPNTKQIGYLQLILSILITVAGFSNVIIINLGIDILGVTERVVLFSLQTMIISISFFEIKPTTQLKAIA